MESDTEMDFQSQGYDQGEREAMVAWERSNWLSGLILRWNAQDLLMHVIWGLRGQEQPRMLLVFRLALQQYWYSGKSHPRREGMGDKQIKSAPLATKEEFGNKRRVYSFASGHSLQQRPYLWRASAYQSSTFISPQKTTTCCPGAPLSSSSLETTGSQNDISGTWL